MNDAVHAPTFTVLTIFPEMFPGPLGYGVLGKALERGLFRLDVRDLRDWAPPPHHQVDDAPFGGGAGMVMKPEPLFAAIEELRAAPEEALAHVVLLDPAGSPFTQEKARKLAGRPRTLMVCGRYEGIDGRVREQLVDEEISLGDFVLTGGELAAMAVIEASARLVPEVVGQQASIERDSFENGLLDHPHYTRPASFRGLGVPEVLLSGHHEKIESWRRARSQELTRSRRPDLLERGAPKVGAAGSTREDDRR
jgi:tRNA (guanine37-N1)-methyltransferase